MRARAPAGHGVSTFRHGCESIIMWTVDDVKIRRLFDKCCLNLYFIESYIDKVPNVVHYEIKSIKTAADCNVAGHSLARIYLGEGRLSSALCN